MIPEEYKEKVNEIRSEIMEKVAEGPSELVNYVAFSFIDNGFDEKDCDDFIKKAFLLYDSEASKTAGAADVTVADMVSGARALRGGIGGTAGAMRDVGDIASMVGPFTPWGRPTIGQKITSFIGKHLPIALGAGILGAFGAKKLLEKSKEKVLADSALKAILKEKPELAADPNIYKFYNTIKRFAPSLASDKHILESALEHAHEYGRLDYPMMKELIEMQTKLEPRQPHFQTAKTLASVV